MRIDHIVLEVTDPERSVEFYQDIVGLAPVRLDQFRTGGVKFASLRIEDGSLIDLFPPSMWRGPVAQNPNHVCLSTTSDGLAALKARLAARSIPITRMADHGFGAQGFGRSVYFDDPDGITIEIRDYPPK